MPLMGQPQSEVMNVAGSTFQFSAVRPEDLSETRYTLVGIAVDVSGSVHSFQNELLACLQEIVKSCKAAPLADYILLRLITFDDKLNEVHGFLPVKTIDELQYVLNSGGCTALFDSVYSLVGSVTDYAVQMSNRADIDDINGIVFIVTDGEDNASKFGPADVLKKINEALRSEKLESLLTVLVGINAGGCSTYLQRFAADAKITEYIDAGSADAKSLGRLARFVSSSVSSQSQALGTGGPSQSLTF